MQVVILGRRGKLNVFQKARAERRIGNTNLSFGYDVYYDNCDRRMFSDFLLAFYSMSSFSPILQMFTEYSLEILW